MHIPRWKRWLSYLVEFHLESAPSAWNPHLYVSLRRGRFQLCTANAVYSYGDLYDNFFKAFRRLDLSSRSINDVLLLGFGLGSIPLMLEQKFEQQYRYIAVEADESVIYLAGKYVLPSIQAPVELHCADAYVFVQQTCEKYDLICMDVFLDDKIPENFESENYLELLKTCLHPGGILLFNRLSANHEDRRRSHAYFEEVFKKVFPDGQYWDLGGNWMLIGESEATPSV